MITIVGIGHQKGDITESGKNAIKAAKFAISRPNIGIKTDETLQDIQKAAADFDHFNTLATQYLLAKEQEHGDIVFVTHGDGFSDPLAAILAQKTQTRHIAGAAHPRPAATSVVSLSAFDLPLRPTLDNLPLLVTDILDGLIAGEVKLFLLKFYAFGTKVVIFSGEKTTQTTLEELDRQRDYKNAAVFLAPSQGFDKQLYTFGDLLRIMERLTAVDGCPWDKEQTHESIRANMIEEAYEAVRAIDTGDTDNLIEELGDVLLQSVFHADIAARFGEFELTDVLSTLCRKLFSRHTHIFGGAAADSSGQALSNWEQAKAKEKAAAAAKAGDDASNVADEFMGFPALLRAQKLAKRRLKRGDLAVCESDEKIEQSEVGQLLFKLVAQCQSQGIDAETELNCYLNNLKN